MGFFRPDTIQDFARCGLAFLAFYHLLIFAVGIGVGYWLGS